MFSGENFDFQDLVFKKCVFQLLAYVLILFPIVIGIPRINNWRALHNLLLFTTQATIIQMIKSNIVILVYKYMYLIIYLQIIFPLFFFCKKRYASYI